MLVYFLHWPLSVHERVAIQGQPLLPFVAAFSSFQGCPYSITGRHLLNFEAALTSFCSGLFFISWRLLLHYRQALTLFWGSPFFFCSRLFTTLRRPLLKYGAISLAISEGLIFPSHLFSILFILLFVSCVIQRMQGKCKVLFINILNDF